MRRTVLAAMLLLPPFAACAQGTQPAAQPAASPIAQQQLVDRATLAAQEMLNDVDGKDAQYLLRRARATLICPRVVRAGFIFGGQGGDCVLVARDGAGSWSSPAFYGMGSGSVGFQAGIQDAEIMLMIMTDRGLNSMMDSQFKLGADAGAVFVSWGGGVEGGLTAALSADIVGFTRARGLYAGISISGSGISTKTDWNEAYYGRPLAGRQIVMGMEASNPAADPLRLVLTRAGTQAAPALPPPVPQGGANPGYVQDLPPARGTVQSQPLAPLPPRR